MKNFRTHIWVSPGSFQYSLNSFCGQSTPGEIWAISGVISESTERALRKITRTSEPYLYWYWVMMIVTLEKYFQWSKSQCYSDFTNAQFMGFGACVAGSSLFVWGSLYRHKGTTCVVKGSDFLESDTASYYYLAVGITGRSFRYRACQRPASLKRTTGPYVCSNPRLDWKKSCAVIANSPLNHPLHVSCRSSLWANYRPSDFTQTFIHVYVYVCMCECLCVWECEREIERETERKII